MDVFVPEPKLSIRDVPEAASVFVPRAVEVEPRRDVAAPLEDRPPTAVGVHVAVHVNGIEAAHVGIYCVNATLAVAVVVYILAVSVKVYLILKAIVKQLRQGFPLVF